MRNLCKLFLALVLGGLCAEVAAAQTTTVTAGASSLTFGGSPITTGLSIFIPVDASGRGIAVTKSGGGLNLPVASQPASGNPIGYDCTITNGALAGGCSVPDAGTSNPNGFGYNITICDTSVGNPSSGQCATLTQVHGVTGATWQLDHYSALAAVTTVGAFTFTLGVGAPTGTGGTNALYADITTPTAPVLYLWNGTAWAGLSGSGGSVTATAIQTALASRSGCNTVGYPYVPQSNNCLPPATSLPGGTGMVKVTGGVGSLGTAGVDYAGVLKPANTLTVFGDSYMYGQGASNLAATGIFPLVSRDTPAPATNYGSPGAVVPQIANQVFQYFAPSPTIPSVSLIDGGANDGTSDTCGGAAGTTCVKNFSAALMAAEAWASIPYQFREMASTATQSGSWSTDNTVALYVSPLYASQGLQEKISSSGKTLTFSVPSSASTKIGVTYAVTTAQTGTFTISIDGTLQTDLCSGTTTFSSGPCSALLVLSSTLFRQEFTVTGGTTHTVVVATTNASNVSIASVDWIPPAGTANVNAVFPIGPNAAFLYAATYNAASKAVANQLQADGLPVYYVDQIGGTPGVNATTDISTSATATCPASASSNHPNDCGYLHMLQTLNNVEAANGYVFSSLGAGGETVASTGNIYSPLHLTVPNGGLATHANTHSNMNQSAAGEAGMDFYVGNGGPWYGSGFGVDGSTGLPYSGAVMTHVYGSQAGGWFCAQLYDASGSVGSSHYTSGWCTKFSTGESFQNGSASAKYFAASEGTAIASASTIAPTTGVVHVTGTVAIATMTPPANCTALMACEIKLIPDGLWTTTTGGNFALGTTAVVGKVLILTYDATTAKWYPSY